MKILTLPILSALALLLSSITCSVLASPNETKLDHDKVSEVTKLALVNLNTANAKELATLPGIGESRALRIINYREQNGQIK